ncbi:MAG TPA: selenium-dependent molybdenum cofactor biosynthesis protein YqeB [Thermoanaerobaculaceae bacterium]|nr:selenium-dependent molybdenum cofactor biosynthesis protein YqeB [Thermoanaerobaculaceae bacterium]HRS15724.1 selenium-dependent molybdenum cofactor biosynthesis protein YqeB [Thermoanaerobaculaceae bacterium]
MAELSDVRILIRGGGELGSAVAAHLARQGAGRILLVEGPFPKAVRRNVCFSEAVFEHAKTVEGVTARFVMLLSEIDRMHEMGDLAITTQALPEVLAAWPPDVYVEAAMLRSNWGLSRELAPIVIALGPGFQAGKDCHAVVETTRGPRLGRVLSGGHSLAAAPPAEIMGYSQERVIKAQRAGVFRTAHRIGDRVEQGEKIGVLVLLFERADLYRGVPVDCEYPVVARIGGVIRGLLRDGVPVVAGDKIGDIDPRGLTEDLEHLSDKAVRVAEGVHEAIVLNLGRLPADRRNGVAPAS